MNQKSILIVGLTLLVSCNISNETNEVKSIHEEMCDCLLTLDESKNQNSTKIFSECLYPFLNKEWNNTETTKSSFLDSLNIFFLKMDSTCIDFRNKAKLFVGEGVYHSNINPQDSINLSMDSCAFLKKSQWIYEDDFQGELLYNFNETKLIITSLEKKHKTTFNLEKINDCSCKLEFKESESPYSLIVPDNAEQGIYFKSYSNDTLRAYYEVESGVYQEIILRKQ